MTLTSRNALPVVSILPVLLCIDLSIPPTNTPHPPTHPLVLTFVGWLFCFHSPSTGQILMNNPPPLGSSYFQKVLAILRGCHLAASRATPRRHPLSMSCSVISTGAVVIHRTFCDTNPIRVEFLGKKLLTPTTFHYRFRKSSKWGEYKINDKISLLFKYRLNCYFFKYGGVIPKKFFSA